MELKRVSQVSRSSEGEREGAFSRDERTSNSRGSSLFSVFPAERVGRSRIEGVKNRAKGRRRMVGGMGGKKRRRRERMEGEEEDA